MGLVILPTALLIALAWTAFLVFFASKLVARLRGSRFPKLAKLLVYLGVVILGWVLPSLPGLMEQQRMDKVASNCGWTVKRDVAGIEGIYLEGKTLSYLAGELLSTYHAIEYEFNGRLARIVGSEAISPLQPEYISGRTFRYGLKRVASGLVERAIWRDELAIVDFDTNETLAHRVEYSYVESSPNSILGYAIAVLQYQPKNCGHTNPAQTDISPHVRRILRSTRDSKLVGSKSVAQPGSQQDAAR
jgi:hypothetical protein